MRAKVCLLDNDQSEYEIFTLKAAFTEKERNNSVVGVWTTSLLPGIAEEVLLPEGRAPLLSGDASIQPESERRELLGAAQEAVTHRDAAHS